MFSQLKNKLLKEREYETLMQSFHVTQYMLLKARFQRHGTQRKMKMMFLKLFERNWNETETKAMVGLFEDRVGLIASDISRRKSFQEVPVESWTV